MAFVGVQWQLIVYLFVYSIEYYSIFTPFTSRPNTAIATMRIITLADNKTQSNELKTEHGLSLYIETDDNQKILYDTGQSNLFIQNAKKLGVDLNRIDKVVISHGHYDHIGGLIDFLQINSTAKVYINATLFNYKYFSLKNGVKKLNGFSPKLLAYRNRFVLLDKNTHIDNLWMITTINKPYNMPKGNAILYRQKDGVEELDKFDHELILAINTTKGLCVFTGCAHNGILNIANTIQTTLPHNEIYCMYGGFHLIDGKEYVEVETAQELTQIAHELTKLLPKTQFYTGHCTGEKAINTLSQTMKEQLKPFYVGMEITM